MGTCVSKSEVEQLRVEVTQLTEILGGLHSELQRNAKEAGYEPTLTADDVATFRAWLHEQPEINTSSRTTEFSAIEQSRPLSPRVTATNRSSLVKGASTAKNLNRATALEEFTRDLTSKKTHTAFSE